ncbi:MAG: hypothetical protein A3D92_15645 [Bacteroidetes bacterium RIFCSPHIGHO2_02_FULL_44_7]|nr:MAG: hypothetical protein A3D92_15645 [Bacteroidetes bacterium RIFCSPHIGHO2_02_FULL_44_7]
MIQNPPWLVNKHPNDLKAQIMELLHSGYVVTAQTDKTAQLIRRRHFSCLIATILFLCFAIPFFLYLFYYLAKRDDVIYLDLDTQQRDPLWQEHESKRIKDRNIWIAASVVLILIFISVLSASDDASNLSSSDQAQENTTLLTPEQTLTQQKATLRENIDFLENYQPNIPRDQASNLEIEVALWSALGGIAKEAKASEDSEVIRLGMQLETALKKMQSREFPKIRKAYADLMARKLWEEDVEVSTRGSLHSTLAVTGAVFAANKNIASIHSTIEGMLKILRFDRAEYRWYSGASQYQYFSIDSKADSEI